MCRTHGVVQNLKRFPALGSAWRVRHWCAFLWTSSNGGGGIGGPVWYPCFWCTEGTPVHFEVHANKFKIDWNEQRGCAISWRQTKLEPVFLVKMTPSCFFYCSLPAWCIKMLGHAEKFRETYVDSRLVSGPDWNPCTLRRKFRRRGLFFC